MDSQLVGLVRSQLRPRKEGISGRQRNHKIQVLRGNPTLNHSKLNPAHRVNPTIPWTSVLLEAEKREVSELQALVSSVSWNYSYNGVLHMKSLWSLQAWLWGFMKTRSFERFWRTYFSHVKGFIFCFVVKWGLIAVTWVAFKQLHSDKGPLLGYLSLSTSSSW